MSPKNERVVASRDRDTPVTDALRQRGSGCKFVKFWSLVTRWPEHRFQRSSKVTGLWKSQLRESQVIVCFILCSNHYVDDRLALLGHVSRVDSAWSFGKDQWIASSKTVPLLGRRRVFVTSACWSVGNFAFICDNSRHLFDSYFPWSKVSVFIKNKRLLYSLQDHY